MNKEAAQKVSDLMQRFGKELSESIRWVAEDSPDEEVVQYKAAVATILTDMLIEIMNPLYRLYPDLTPEELETVPHHETACSIHSQVGFGSKKDRQGPE